jgi:hypothetical protein
MIRIQRTVLTAYICVCVYIYIFMALTMCRSPHALAKCVLEEV